MTLEPCQTCKGGTVKIEQFQQRFPRKDGGEVWLPEDFAHLPELPQHAIDDLRAIVLRDQPWNFRWQEVECPRCQGQGEYWVELVPCKIF